MWPNLGLVFFGWYPSNFNLFERKKERKKPVIYISYYLYLLLNLLEKKKNNQKPLKEPCIFMLSTSLNRHKSSSGGSNKTSKVNAVEPKASCPLDMLDFCIQNSKLPLSEAGISFIFIKFTCIQDKHSPNASLFCNLSFIFVFSRCQTV